MKRVRLEIIVFICGFISMSLELAAARIMSPYVGSSNVVWTSIIGVILVSMSLGYFLGGKLSLKKSNYDVLSILLLISAVSMSLIILLETIVVKYFSININNLIISTILCAIIVFSLPSVILSMISPCCVKIKCEESKDIGLSSGKISSISTLGSIMGTFTMGFLLIPSFGVSNIIVTMTFIVFLSSIIIKNTWNKKNIILFIIIFLIIISFIFIGKIVFKNKNLDLVLDVDTQYSRIWIKENLYWNRQKKYLYIDTAVESYYESLNNGNNTFLAKYLYFYDLFEYFVKNPKKTLMIGGGGYTYATYYLNKYLDKTIDVVEIDQKITDIAISHFGLDPSNERLKIYTQDGRSFLNYSNNKYDVILIDAFKGFHIPFELTTYEAIISAKRMLNENGVIIINIISAVEGENSDFTKYEYSTYKKVFKTVKIFKVSPVNDYEKQNLILVATDENNFDNSKYLEYKIYLQNEISIDSDKPILTDDYCPIGN